MSRQSIAARMRRKKSIRKTLRGTAEKPRLTVFRSARHIYVQAIDDIDKKTVASASTLQKEIQSELDGIDKKAKAKKVGLFLGKKLVEKGVKKAVFDRNGYLYHGRVAALAAGAREAGLRF